MRALAGQELSWSAEEIAEALAATADLEDSTLEVGYEDFALLLRSVLETAGRRPLGGDGGGVQVLDVTEAARADVRAPLRARP